MAVGEDKCSDGETTPNMPGRTRKGGGKPEGGSPRVVGLEGGSKADDCPEVPPGAANEPPPGRKLVMRVLALGVRGAEAFTVLRPHQ